MNLIESLWERQRTRKHPWPLWPRYLAALLCGVAMAAASLAVLFSVLAGAGSLPPPAIANNLCIDEKLDFMREQGVGKPNLLFVGSSVAWRHVDSGAFARTAPGIVPYNGGFCGLPITQTAAVTHWLLQRLPTVNSVVLLASPMDFEKCWLAAPSAFDVAEADRFIFGNTWRWSAYLRFFDPVSLIRNAATLTEQRSNRRGADPLLFTKYGDGPLSPSRQFTLVYHDVVRLDPLCFQALRSLAHDLTTQGISVMVVNTPVHSEWKAIYDADGRMETALYQGIESALSNTGAHFWNGDKAFTDGPGAFTDAIHLRWGAAGRFTRMMAQDYNRRILLKQVGTAR